MHILLRRDGLRINYKKVHRLYCEERLQLKPRRHRRRRAATVRTPRPVVTGPNERWAMDFMHDMLANGPTIRVFTLSDSMRQRQRIHFDDPGSLGLLEPRAAGLQPTWEASRQLHLRGIQQLSET